MDLSHKHIIPDYFPLDPDINEPDFIHEFTIEQSVEREKEQEHNPPGTRRNPSNIQETYLESSDRQSREHNSYLVAQQDQAWWNLQIPIRLKEKRNYLEIQNQLLELKINRDALEWVDKWVREYPNHTEEQYRYRLRLSEIKRDELINFIKFDIDYECRPDRLFLEVDSVLPVLMRKNTFDW